MVVRTKKYKLDTNTFVKLGLWGIVLDWWWVWLVPIAILLIPIFVKGAIWWCIPIALVLVLLYLLFWGAQFVGATQMDQFKPFFQKMTYEFDTQKIILKMGKDQPMAMRWEMIKGAKKHKKYYLLTLSRVQFFYLPFEIFKSENDLKIFEKMLQRKNLL